MGGIDMASEPGARRVLDAMAGNEVEDVLKLLDARHLAPTKDQRQQVTTCTDATQLNLWFDRAITADTAAEVFAD
jgi:hypothetical protein